MTELRLNLSFISINVNEFNLPIKRKSIFKSETKEKLNFVLYTDDISKTFKRVEIKVGLERSISSKVEFGIRRIYNRCPL